MNGSAESAHDAEPVRRVTWLELFFDLIFVAAVAEVAEPLRHHFDLAGLGRFAVLFALIWWAWTGYATFATRFGIDNGAQRLFTLLQMFVVAAMAANAGDGLDSRSSAGFAAAYAVLRLILVAQYLNARHDAHARPLTVRYIAGHGSAALIWLVSALVPAPARYGLWALALLIDLGTPWVALAHTLRAPPHSAHLPERFGLFTLILLGEAVVAVMHGMKSQEGWSVSAAASAFCGMGLLFVLWHWYFDRAQGAADRRVRTALDTVRLQIWSFAHFPLYLGMVTIGVGIQRLVGAATRQDVPHQDILMMAGAAAMLIVSMTVIAATRDGATAWPRLVTRAALAASVTVAAAWMTGPQPAVIVVAGLAIVCATQLAGGTGTRRPAFQ